MDYLKRNKEYWEKGYPADNVESHVFRPYGRVLKYELGLDGSRHEKLLDFGCGQGAALRFFRSKGFDVYGVDISETDIAACKARMPEIEDHFRVVDPKPRADDSWFGGGFDIVVAVQSLYYFTNTDFEVRIRNIYDQIRPGGYIYATMIGTKMWYYEHSTPYLDGLRKVEISTPRLTLKDYYVFFTESKEELAHRFRLFEKRHIGFYDASYREDEPSDFHYVFIGQKAWS